MKGFTECKILEKMWVCYCNGHDWWHRSEKSKQTVSDQHCAPFGVCARACICVQVCVCVHWLWMFIYCASKHLYYSSRDGPVSEKTSKVKTLKNMQKKLRPRVILKKIWVETELGKHHFPKAMLQVPYSSISLPFCLSLLRSPQDRPAASYHFVLFHRIDLFNQLHITLSPTVHEKLIYSSFQWIFFIR